MAARWDLIVSDGEKALGFAFEDYLDLVAVADPLRALGYICDEIEIEISTVEEVRKAVADFFVRGVSHA